MMEIQRKMEEFYKADLATVWKQKPPEQISQNTCSKKGSIEEVDASMETDVCINPNLANYKQEESSRNISGRNDSVLLKSLYQQQANESGGSRGKYHQHHIPQQSWRFVGVAVF
ncbi:unnamed protein product [Timema podura]|uniref:Uncharacterized protein n=1 Tax=Timema podura TaxID=61482 RepID=A0ABN7NMV0_TIMPD|nr:unnamed protein product [Timema podura]